MAYSRQLDALLQLALEEDLQGGDLTTESTIDEDAMASAEAIAKSELVLSGGEIFARSFHAVDPACRVVQLVPDGTRAPAGTLLFRIDGPSRSLLMAERTALNFLQRLSGTATLTRKFVDAAGGRTRICDTRKTTPGFRYLERCAVRDGGGHNHRDNLSSAVMIKDNHIAASGGIAGAVAAARAYIPHTCKVEVEVSNLEELEQALTAAADIIMLDNFGEKDSKEAIKRAHGKAIIELSGNMSLERVAELSHWGADVISVGALTHSAPAADISLRIFPAGEGAPALPGT